MASLAELHAKWEARLSEWRALGVQVNGAALASEVLADLAAIDESAASEVLTLAEASAVGGYSVDHLSRLIREGAIENVGRKHAPRIRRRDVPAKTGHTLPGPARRDQFTPRRQIASEVLNRERSA